MQSILDSVKDLISKPDVKRPYSSLATAYIKSGFHKEAEIIGKLVEKRFGKNEPDSTHSTQEQ